MAYQLHIRHRHQWTDERSNRNPVQIGRFALSRRTLWLMIAVLALVGLLLTLTIADTNESQSALSASWTVPQAGETQLIFESSCSPYAALAGCVTASNVEQHQPPA